MRSNINILPFILSILVFLFFMGCKQDVVEPNEKISTEEISTNSLSKNNKDSIVSLSKVAPMRPINCADGRLRVYHNTWEPQNQFQPVSGKYIGAMNDGLSTNQINYSQYACRIVMTGDYNLITQLHLSGYSLDQIYLGLTQSVWSFQVDTAIRLGVHHFYIDEPVYRGLQSMVLQAAPYIAASGGDLTISESNFNPLSIGDVGGMVDLALLASPHPYVCCHTHFEYNALIFPRKFGQKVKIG